MAKEVSSTCQMKLGPCDYGSATLMQNATAFCTSPVVGSAGTGKGQPSYRSTSTENGIETGRLWAFCANRSH